MYVYMIMYVYNDGTNIEFYNIILYTIVTVQYHRQGTRGFHFEKHSTCEASHGFSLVSAIGLAKSDPNFIVFFFIFV